LFVSTLEKIQEMPEVAWARPVGSGCRVFRARNRVVYVFRVATAVAALDVEQPGPELDLCGVLAAIHVFEDLIADVQGGRGRGGRDGISADACTSRCGSRFDDARSDSFRDPGTVVVGR
jgi:hypothetical protein